MGSVILVVVDRLSKNAHFIALSHPYTAITVSQAFFDNIFKLHGMPRTIVSARDKIFLSQIWKELFSLQVDLLMSTAYHPQNDGQTEAVNKCSKFEMHDWRTTKAMATMVDLGRLVV